MTALPGSWAPGRPFRVLCLSGGGYFGLFSARVLAAIEQRIGAPIHTRFDLIAGTSAGGLIALGLASGRSAADSADLMQRDGPAIFPPPRMGRVGRTLRGLFRSRYDGRVLRSIAEAIVGDAALRPGRPNVLVPAVSLRTGALVTFRSATPPAPGIKLADIAMATAAAQLCFPTATTGAGRCTDGGLAANTPDLLALLHAETEIGIPREVIRVLSIGTTKRPIGQPASGAPRKGVLAWLSDLYLVSYQTAPIPTLPSWRDLIGPSHAAGETAKAESRRLGDGPIKSGHDGRRGNGSSSTPAGIIRHVLSDEPGPGHDAHAVGRATLRFHRRDPERGAGWRAGTGSVPALRRRPR